MVDIKKKITILLSIGIFCLISWNIHPLDINGGGDSQDLDVRVGNLRQKTKITCLKNRIYSC